MLIGSAAGLWTYFAVTEPNIKKQIREAAEIEEREFYQTRAPQEWFGCIGSLGNRPKQTLSREGPLSDCGFRQVLWCVTCVHRYQF